MIEFLGYRPDLEDHESIALGSAPYKHQLMASEWQEADMFSWWHVRNQGPKGSCRGHSLAANARLCYYIAQGEIDLDKDGISNESNLQDDFSADYCYYECQRNSGIHGDNGATIAGGIPVGLDGIAREVDLPYETRYAPSRVTDDIRAKAKQFKFKRYTKLKTAHDVFDWVGSGQGGMDWGTVWPLPFTKGCLVKGMSPRQRGGGHATAGGCLIRGSTLKKLVPALAGDVTDDEWVMQCMNSHSTSAQYKGFYFVTLNGCADVLAHSWTEAIGWSDIAEPRPRKIDFTKRSLFG